MNGRNATWLHKLSNLDHTCARSATRLTHSSANLLSTSHPV